MKTWRIYLKRVLVQYNFNSTSRFVSALNGGMESNSAIIQHFVHVWQGLGVLEYYREFGFQFQLANWNLMSLHRVEQTRRTLWMQ